MKQIRIQDYIPVGQRNAISRERLSINTGLPDRDVRRLIELSDELIINLGNGYFIPDKGEEHLVRQYRRQELSRMFGNDRKIKKIDSWLNKKEETFLEGEQMNISEFLEN